MNHKHGDGCGTGCGHNHSHEHPQEEAMLWQLDSKSQKQELRQASRNAVADFFAKQKK